MPQAIAKIAAVALMFSCSGVESNPEHFGVGGNQGNIAHAAPSSVSSEPVMPDNPAHISFRFDRLVPNVEVDYLSQNKYPYRVSVEGDKTIVTIFPPQGVKISVRATPVDEDGNQVGDARTITVDPKAKLGTYDLKFEGTDKSLEFGAGVQQKLTVGANTVHGPNDKQFVGETTDSVRHSVYTAQYDQVCEVTFWGCSEMRVVRQGPAECHKKDFSMELKAGEQVGLYPVNSDSPVDVDLAAQPTQTEE